MGLRIAALTHILLVIACISILNAEAQARSADQGISTALLNTNAATCPGKQIFLVSNPSHCPLVLDDRSTTKTWEPWSSRPYCVAENKKYGWTKLDDENVAKGEYRKIEVIENDNAIKYCLFTNSFFGDYGISLLARPEAAAKAAGILSDAYYSTFPSPDTVQYLNLEPAYQVVDMPDKGGKGVIATRHIKRRETFMVDYVSIAGDLNMWGSIPEKEGRDLLDRAAEQLVDPQYVMALGRGSGGDGVEGIIAANTFRTYLDGVPQKALFPKISVRPPPSTIQ